MYRAEAMEGAGRFQAWAALTRAPYQAATAMCQGRMKKMVHTAQSMRLALRAGARPKRSPMGRTRLGPTSSSAGALAEMGMEARTVEPMMKSSA